MSLLYSIIIEPILEDTNLSILNKIQKLDNLLVLYTNIINDAKFKITKDYMYCENCKDYYNKQNWKKEQINNIVQYKCPKGHIIIDDYDC